MMINLLLAVTLLLTKLLLINAQNPCISTLNLTEANVPAQPDGTFVFVTPNVEKVPQNIVLQFLCCFLSVSNMAASFPEWKFNPDSSSDSFILGSLEVAYFQDGQRILFSYTTNVTTSPSINATEVRCLASRGSTSFRSDPRTLIVVGPPPPPAPILEIAQDSVIVRWDPVFSWPEYPVTGYELELFRSSHEQPVYTNVINETVLNFPLQFVQNLTNQLQECEEVVLSVRAINSIGRGEPGNITKGLPKQNGLTFFNSTVRATVLFSAELQPEVQFEILLPSLCPYQTLEYTFVVTGYFNATSQNISVNGQVSMINPPDELQVPVVDINMEKVYSVYAILRTDGGESISTEPTTFSTVTTLNFDCPKFPEGDVAGVRLEIVYALGALCAALLILLTILLCAVCIKKRCCCVGKRSGGRENVMVHNPIYAGPIYDSVYDSRGRLLTSNVSTPSSVGTPDFPPSNNVKLMENSLMMEYEQAKRPLEPRYSSNSTSASTAADNAADCYVKMKGKVPTENGSRGTTLEPVMDEELIDFGQVSDV